MWKPLRSGGLRGDLLKGGLAKGSGERGGGVAGVHPASIGGIGDRDGWGQEW